jgi:hypothetical protein
VGEDNVESLKSELENLEKAPISSEFFEMYGGISVSPGWASILLISSPAFAIQIIANPLCIKSRRNLA